MAGPEKDSILRGTVSLSEAMPVVETTAANTKNFGRQTQEVQKEILEFAKVYLDFLNNPKDEDKRKFFFNFWNLLGISETVREMAVSIVLRSQEAMRRKFLEV